MAISPPGCCWQQPAREPFCCVKGQELPPTLPDGDAEELMFSGTGGEGLE